MYSLASPYDAEYPLNQSDRRPPCMGSNFENLDPHSSILKRRLIPRRELDQLIRCGPRVVGILSDSFYDALRFRAIKKS
jgi:hypothetical protein